VAPLNFDFSAAYLVIPEGMPKQERMADTGGSLARIRTTVTGGMRMRIVIKGVRLGLDGGQTLVRITSWTGGMLQNGVWNPGTKKDERLDCGSMCSFMLPGSLDISYDKLQNQYQQNPLMYPVQSRWEAQMGRPAQIEFRFSLTQPARVGNELWIYGLPYQPTMQMFSLAEAPLVTFGTIDDPSSRAIKNKLKDVLDRKLKVTLVQGLATYTVYQVVFSVILPTPKEKAALGKPIRWTLETWAYPYGEYPTNSNDGVSREFPIVEEYKFRVETSRAPPVAEVNVGIYVEPGINAPTSLVVVAPLLFNFSTDCLVNGGGFVSSCSPNTPMPDGRKTALLKVLEPGLQRPTTGLIIKVQTPAKAPLNKAWFIEGRDAFTDAQFGWGEAEGVVIEQMAETAVTYPGVPGIAAKMVFRFKTQVLIESGGSLQVELPEGFDPKCSGVYFDSIALPTTGGCKILDPTNLLVMLNSTMVPGEYALAITVSPPAQQPIRNAITLILKDRLGNVRDAAVDIVGLDIQDKLKIQSTPLMWSQSKALRSSVITLGFEAVEPLPDLVVGANQQVSEILISLPVGFVHLVNGMNDFTAVNEDMPFQDPNWLDFLQKDRLRITLNLNRSSWTTLKPGRYQFRFPVLVPSPMPIFNVWYVSLCKPNYPEGCNRVNDPGVLLTFPLPGFDIGEVYGGGKMGLTSAASGRRRPLTEVGALWSLATLMLASCLLGQGQW